MEHTNWQDTEPTKAHSKPSPNLLALLDWLLRRFGGAGLGIYGARPIRGGTSPSSHAHGAALDWRYADPGPGRTVALGQVLPFLIDHAEELHIQQIHDYNGSRIWRADRGWKTHAPDGYGMGQAWAQYFHIETNEAGWNDATPIETRIGGDAGGIATWPPFNPERGEYGLWPIATKPTIRRGATGDVVRYLQAIIGAVVDGQFGPMTERTLLTFQRSNRLAVDGIAGPKTWAEIDATAAVREMATVS